MPTNKILFSTDFSRLSDAALPLATSLARDRGAELIFVHVQEPPTAYAAGELYYGPLEPNTKALQQMLDAVQPTDPKVPCSRRIEMGDPAREITRVAEEEGVDLIVISSHGRTGLSRVLMGSVAEAVVRRASCPVLTFKQPHHKP